MRTLGILVMMALSYGAFQAEPSLASTAVSLRQSVTFINAGGETVTLNPGEYSVRPVSPWLEIIPKGGTRRDAVLLKTQPMRHSERSRSTRVHLNETDQQGELVVFFPGGKGLKAVGTFDSRPSKGFTTKTPILNRSVISAIRRAGEPQKKNPVPPKFKPTDPWDKLLLNMVQALTSRVKQLENQLATFKQQYPTHQHEFEIPHYGEGGAAWVTIKQLRKMEDDKSQYLDNYGMYFRGKANSGNPFPPKQTSGPEQ